MRSLDPARFVPIAALILALGGSGARAASIPWEESMGAAALDPWGLSRAFPLGFGTRVDQGDDAFLAERAAPFPTVTPSAITGTPAAQGSDLECPARLAVEGLTFELAGPTEGIATPIRLSSLEIGGIRFRSYYPGPTPWVFDCRLALALVRAAPVLRANGVTEVIFASHYRPSLGSMKRGEYHFHAQGLAIDIKGFRVGKGVLLDVARDYESGLGFMDSSSCLGRPITPKGLWLRHLICDLDEADVFESILTPDYDEKHWNHLHFSAFHPEQRSLLRPRGTALLEVPFTELPDWALSRPLSQRPEERRWDSVAGRLLEPELALVAASFGIPERMGPSEAAAALLDEPRELPGILGLVVRVLARIGPEWREVMEIAEREATGPT